MVKLLATLTLCVLLFGGGLAVSLYLRPPAAPPENGEAAQSSAAQDETTIDALPMPVRDRPMGADEVFRFAASIRARQRDLQRREEQIEHDETRVKMLQEDLRAERNELEGLLVELQDNLERSRSMLEAVEAQQEALQQQRVDASQTMLEAAKTREQFSVNEVGNVKTIATWLNGMEPESAAVLLEKLVNDGEMNMVVRVLANLEERKASAVLASLQDLGLSAQLTRQFMQYQRPPKPKRK